MFPLYTFKKCLFMIKISECFELSKRTIQSMVDYIWWTSDYDPHLYALFCRSFRLDNWSFRYLNGYSVAYSDDTYMISVSYMDHVLPVARIQRTNISWQNQIRWDIYGKWLVYLRATSNFMQLFSIFSQIWLKDLNLTRYDHCADTIHTWFNNASRLIKKIKKWSRDSHFESWVLTYVRMWSRRSNQFYRVYDKTLDLSDSWHWRLYPEYNWLHILRYEVQVTSKWICKEDKSMTYQKIIDLANASLYLKPDLRYRKSDQIYAGLRDRILAIRREGSIDQLIWLRDRLSSHVDYLWRQIEQLQYIPTSSSLNLFNIDLDLP